MLPEMIAFSEAAAVEYLIPTEPAISETFIVDEIEGLRQRGVEVRVTVLSDQPAWGTQRLRSWWRLMSRRWYAVPAWLRGVFRLRREPIWVLARSIDIAAGWLTEPPRRVHVHFVDQPLVAAALASRLVPVTITATAHAHDLFFSPPRRFPFLQDYGVRFVAVCRYNAASLVQRGVTPQGIVVIPCGVNTAVGTTFVREPESLGGRLRVLVVARLVEKKGIDDLLCAVLQPSVAAHVEEIRLIGDGPMKARIAALAAEVRGRGVEVREFGALPRQDHAPHFRWANLFVLPCKIARDGDRDSMPVAVKEAVVRYVPVLTTRTVGIPEMLDEDTGVFAEPGDIASIGDALRRYAGLSEHERHALAIRGARRMQERFSFEQTHEAMANLMLHDVVPTQWSGAL